MKWDILNVIHRQITAKYILATKEIKKLLNPVTKNSIGFGLSFPKEYLVKESNIDLVSSTVTINLEKNNSTTLLKGEIK